MCFLMDMITQQKNLNNHTTNYFNHLIKQIKQTFHTLSNFNNLYISKPDLISKIGMMNYEFYQNYDFSTY